MGKLGNGVTPVEKKAREISAPLTSVRISLEQFGLMLASGVGVVQVLDILEKTTEADEGLAAAFESISRDLQSGRTLSMGMYRFPRVFPQTLVRLVRVGEQSGRLVPSLSLATEWLRRQEELGRKIKKAFSYPVVVLAVAFVVNLLVLNFCLPEMRAMVAGFGGVEPWLTRVVFLLGEIVVHPLSFILLLSTVLLSWFKRHTIMDKFGYRGFKLLLGLPLLGPLLRCAALARFCSTLATCLEVNLTFLKSLDLSLAACGNPVYEKNGNALIELIKNGDSLSEALNLFPSLYPNLVRQSIQAGEETGEMSKSLRSVTTLLEAELDYRIEVLTNLLEPIVLTLCAVFVGLFILAIFLPMQEFLAQIAA